MTRTQNTAKTIKMVAGRRVPVLGPNQYFDRHGNVRTIALRHRVAS